MKIRPTCEGSRESHLVSSGKRLGIRLGLLTMIVFLALAGFSCKPAGQHEPVVLYEGKGVRVEQGMPYDAFVQAMGKGGWATGPCQYLPASDGSTLEVFGHRRDRANYLVIETEKKNGRSVVIRCAPARTGWLDLGWTMEDLERILREKDDTGTRLKR